MAGKNEVTLTFAGESTSLENTFDRVGSRATDMSDKVGRGSASLEGVGESADGLETRFTGLASGIDGVTTLMDDPSPQEFAQGLADIADGIANSAVPALMRLKSGLLTSASSAATAGIAHARAAATTVAGWVAMGLQATINAAKMAAAWLISLGPVGLVIAAVAAIVAILVALGVGFDDIKRWAMAAWDFILGGAKAVWNWLSDNWPLVLAILTGPIGLAVLAIVRNWDTIKAGFTAVKDWIGDRVSDVVGFFTGLPGRMAAAAGDMFGWIGDQLKAGINRFISIWNDFRFPSWTVPRVSIPGLGSIGGNTIGGWSLPHIATLHTGGVFHAPAGQREGLAMLLDGERVTRPGQSATPPIIVNINGTVLAERQVVGVIRDELLRRGFGGLR